MEVNNFINKYYNEFGVRCPFKCTDMISDEQKLRNNFSSRLELDIPLLCKFFETKIDNLIIDENKVFTDTEIEQLKQADHYWDIPKINFIYTIRTVIIKTCRYYIFAEAIPYNSLYILDWLNDVKSWDNPRMYNLATNMNEANSRPKQTCHVFNHSARLGNLKMMKRLYYHGFKFDEETFVEAAKYGDLDNMKWLKEQGCKYGYYAFSGAAKNGNLTNMKWLKEIDCPYNVQTFIDAVENGNIENMEWLLSINVPLHEDVFSTAAEKGDLTILKWLKRHSCPWDYQTIIEASRNGSIENIKWLLDNGCPYDGHILKYIKNLRVLEWLSNNGYVMGVINSDERNTQWLTENGCPPNILKILNIVLQRNDYLG